MKKMLKGFLATAALVLGAPMASAGVINFDFETLGVLGVSDDNSCPSCFQVQTAGVAYETDGLPGVNLWFVEGILNFTAFDSGTGSWKFNDLGGDNHLWGDFSAILGLGTGTIAYTITGGSGLFANALGTGHSTVVYSSILYAETGSMSVVTSVPEPTTLALFGAGLVMLVVATRRRRAAVRAN